MVRNSSIPAVCLILWTHLALAADLASPGPTQLYGHITANRVLTVASPGPNYEVIGDLTIDSGVTLTLERGVSLTATAYSDYLASGIYPGLVEISVSGSLQVPAGVGAVGFGASQPASWLPTVCPWAGIRLNEGASASLPGAWISDALIGIDLPRSATVTCGSPSDADPLTLYECYWGIRTAFGPSHVSNVRMLSCTSGIHADWMGNLGGQFDYCSLVANKQAIAASDYGVSMSLSNSIIYGDPEASITGLSGITGRVAIDHCDVWGFRSSDGGFGTGGSYVSCSSFDPFFADGLRLSPASFFLNSSASGGQIGAYGPGPGGPTPVLRASVVSADGMSGAARIRWYVGDGGEKASIVRRKEGGDWEPRIVLFRDGDGFVDLDDSDVSPGTTYGYAIGTQNKGQIGIDGEVWVTVQQRISALSRPTISPNPARDGWNVSFAVPSTAPTTIEVIDVTGRLLLSRDIGVLMTGRNTTFVPASNLSTGVYWVRVRQGGRTSASRAVRAE